MDSRKERVRIVVMEVLGGSDALWSLIEAIIDGLLDEWTDEQFYGELGDLLSK